MKAVKGNKEYSIEKSQRKFYQDAGYDIIDDAGGIITYGRGKTVPYGEYEAVKKELEELKENHGNADDEDVMDILRCFAHEHGIDLGKSSSVSGIVKKIKEHVPKEGE